MTVSRRWYMVISSFKVESLCFSERPSGFIEGKSRWVSGALAWNFIGSPRFEWFFNTFGQSILSNLKHLHLCKLSPKVENRSALAETLNSFGKLEKLDIISFSLHAGSKLKREFALNLPMLHSIHLEDLYGIQRLTLDAPRLQKVKHRDDLRLDIVHGESVEKLITDCLEHIPVKNLKNLKYLYGSVYPLTCSKLLFTLHQLKEIHLYESYAVSRVFRQKQRYGRTNLKIYFRGLLLNGPDDLAIGSLSAVFDEEAFGCLAENPSRLADEIPFYMRLSYAEIERVAPGLAVDVVNRFTDLGRIYVNEPIRSIQG